MNDRRNQGHPVRQGRNQGHPSKGVIRDIHPKAVEKQR